MSQNHYEPTNRRRRHWGTHGIKLPWAPSAVRVEMAMKQFIEEIMTRDPIRLPQDTSVQEAAEKMKEKGIGAVLIEDEKHALCGVLTDRDIVVRTVAAGGDPRQVPVGSICSKELASLAPRDSIDNAVKLMAKKGVRRVPVLDGNGTAVGIVSLGDLALARDPNSALGGISGKPANA